MLRVFALAASLLSAGCSRSATWLIESAEGGIIKVQRGAQSYTAVCEHHVVLATHIVREGVSACEIPATIAGKSIPVENRERDSFGKVIITELTMVPQGEQIYRLVLRRYREGDPSGGIYESFQILPIGYRPKPKPFSRPIYITDDA